MRETPSLRSAQATTRVCAAPADVAETRVRTRNFPPGNSGKPPGAGNPIDKVVTPETTTCGAENVAPPSIELTHLMVVPTIQKMWTPPSFETVMLGPKESNASGVPTGCAPGPIHVTPASTVRAKASCEPLSQAQYTWPKCGLPGF